MTSPARNLRKRPERLYPMLGVLVLVVLAGITYVAFTANQGLPLESKYKVTVEVPNADRLIKTDEVSVGGIRVGQVADVDGVPAAAGHPAYARIELRLEESVKPLPADTAVRVRPGSVLGSSYVDLVPGKSSRMVADGGTIVLAQATRAVQITDLLDVFDKATARNIQRSLGGLGAGLAGRGADLNTTLAGFSDVLLPLQRVSAAVASPAARFPEFLRGYETALGALGPVSPQLAGVVVGGATTLDAIARENAALARMIEELPPAESAATRAFTNVRPGLDNLAKLVVELRPAGDVLPAALERADGALAAGIRPLHELPRFSRNLRGTLRSLDDVTRAKSTDGAIRATDELLRQSNTFLDAFTPAQVQCNVLPLWSRIGDVFGGIGFGNGPSLVNVFFTTPGASTEAVQNAAPSPDVGINFTGNNNYDECEPGNEPYNGSQQLDSPPGLQSNQTLITAPPTGSLDRARSAGLLKKIGDVK